MNIQIYLKAIHKKAIPNIILSFEDEKCLFKIAPIFEPIKAPKQMDNAVYIAIRPGETTKSIKPVKVNPIKKIQ